MNAKNIAIVSAALFLVACSHNGNQKVKAPTRVKVETVAEGNSVERPSYVGIVEENKSTAVSFTSMGVVSHVYVNEGQSVGRGQLLATMDGTQARNVYSGAQAQMAQAEDALKRYGKLHDNGSLPEVQWVEIQSKVAQARAQLAVAKKNLADCRLTAPVGGVIGRKLVGAGESAMPSQAIVTILDINTVKVKVSIPENEIGAIGANTPSSIFVEAANCRASGGKIEKSVQADALTHTYDIRISVKNPNRQLLPGMVADVTFNDDSTDASSISLPLTSVQEYANGALFVWSITADSTAHRQPVTIGRTFGNRVTISSGLTSGQHIVVEGYQKLSEGTKVIF